MDGRLRPMSDAVSADTALRLLRARTFLYGRQAVLYGNRSLSFSLEKAYRSYDDMQKRGILFVRYGVREIVAEVSAEIDGLGASLIVERPAGLTPAKGGAPGFEDFLRAKRLVAAPGGPWKQVDLQGRIHDVEIHPAGPDRLELKLLPATGTVPTAASKGWRESGRALREAWIRDLLAEWIGDRAPLQLEGGLRPLAPAGAPAKTIARTLAWAYAWTVSRRISQVDIDISGEDVPHVFRWKETTLAEASAYAALDDADIAAALSASGVVLPPDAHRQGMVQEDLGRGSSCLLLRYAHLIPDPDPDAASAAGPASAPPWMNAGFIVMENDYLEVFIDGRTGKVFSESRKWRPAPQLASTHPVPETVGASRD